MFVAVFLIHKLAKREAQYIASSIRVRGEACVLCVCVCRWVRGGE